MKMLKRSSAASVFLSIALAISLFSFTTYAANSNSAGDTNLPSLATVTDAQTQSTSGSKPSATSEGGSKGSPQSTSASQVSITNSGIAASSQIVPTITGGPSATDRPALTGLPKIAGQYSYPPASVPPTQNAPYVRVSNLPEGTVFIAVGAGLGFMAVCVLLWRGIVVWSLHRSVKRAALNQELADTKALFRTPVAPTFKYSDRESTSSLPNIGVRKGGKGGRPSTTTHHPAASQSLFFSPTASMAGAGGLSLHSNRGSNYLPAGYYAAGASSPAGGVGMTHIGSASRENINLTGLRPNSQGYSMGRNMGITPPDSPGLGCPPPLGHRLNPSMSTLELNPRTTAARAPSAYLEDLFDESGAALGQHPQRGRF